MSTERVGLNGGLELGGRHQHVAPAEGGAPESHARDVHLFSNVCVQSKVRPGGSAPHDHTTATERMRTGVDDVDDGSVVVLDVADGVDEVARSALAAAKVAVVEEEHGPPFRREALRVGRESHEVLLCRLRHDMMGS